MANKFTKLNIGDAAASSGGRVWKKLSSMLRLSAPTLSLDGDMLTITDKSGLATSFDILVDGEVKGMATSVTFDLSTLELEEGTYSISVVAKADGYIDSAESEAVSYKVAESLVGTWYFKSTLSLPSSSIYFGHTTVGNTVTVPSIGSCNVKNESSNRSLCGVHVYSKWVTFYTGTSSITAPDVYKSGKWTYSKSQTITFNANADTAKNKDAFLAWLKANATKIA